MIDCQVPSYLINWTSEFLKERSFTVTLNGERSESYPIHAGVPQGAALSPILFSLFINGIPVAQGNESWSLLFADDLALLSKFKKTNEVQKPINATLEEIRKWLCKWRLKIAVSKSQYTRQLEVGYISIFF